MPQHIDTRYETAIARRNRWAAAAAKRGVDTSRKIAGVPDDRAESLHLIDGVKARIGEELFAILFHRVINGHSFSWMAGQGMGESERLGVLFLAAIDATARHFGLRERSRAVETMEQALQIAS
ncbi:hypothetical protein [Methylobacterium sp. R2-1]|uniref:hypothetical protein n=1 Tax=Methylobacterium sp. R2-1 TaxID=2587064 RepID=UPI0016196FA2|nr:hypothetical protein [Methylobacterium sp. R2-1]MBB2964752.1 hypothetical protein [Methylobacterium sp. R2-1]